MSFLRQVFSAHLKISRQIRRHVYNKRVKLYHIIEGSAHACERRLQILEYLPGLCAKISRPNHFSVLVEGGLSGDKNHVSTADLYHLRVTRVSLLHIGWIYEAHSR